MTMDELDRTLLSEDPIEPSSGFTAAVMEAVRREASAPPPIEFPWRRMLAGQALAGGLTAAAVAGVLAGVIPVPSLPWEGLEPADAWEMAKGPVLAAASLFVSWISVRVCLRHATRPA
jgi:hypothetical protein